MKPLRKHAANQRQAPPVVVKVDWAPVYELLISFECFISARMHPLIDLGPAWVREVRQALPAASAAQLTRKNTGAAVRHKEGDDDLLMLLARGCPGQRDAVGFLRWFADLTAGAAYEVLAPRQPDGDGPRLPRDFAAWRDRLLAMLVAWETGYFRTLDPAILSGLRDQAAALRRRIASVPPLELVEEATNGIVIEPAPEMRQVTLVPQYHERPYNQHTAELGGVLMLYPADVLATPADLPSTRLLRLTRALSDESRLRILRFLASGPSTLTEVARFAGLSQPTVHHHLSQLRAAGLVRVHFLVSSPSRYSLRPDALEQLAHQLDAYLHSDSSREESGQA